jgi:hypothetical protein
MINRFSSEERTCANILQDPCAGGMPFSNSRGLLMRL